eukprot:m.50465 g.50465  ORF g.50465 m.50465 type:complete len:128 (+) comp12153_c0_seq2:239-622(+)
MLFFLLSYLQQKRASLLKDFLRNSIHAQLTVTLAVPVSDVGLQASTTTWVAGPSLPATRLSELRCTHMPGACPTGVGARGWLLQAACFGRAVAPCTSTQCALLAGCPGKPCPDADTVAVRVPRAREN